MTDATNKLSISKRLSTIFVNDEKICRSVPWLIILLYRIRYLNICRSITYAVKHTATILIELLLSLICVICYANILYVNSTIDEYAKRCSGCKINLHKTKNAQTCNTEKKLLLKILYIYYFLLGFLHQKIKQNIIYHI